MKHPLIMVAPNGARRTQADHPALPVSLAETIATARACHRAGADALHLHIRDDTGGHSLDPGRYREALSELARTLPNMTVQITTESANIYDVPAQLRTLTQVAPKWASVSIREIARAPDLADAVYGACAHNDTRVQHILYDANDAALLRDWQSRGIVRADQGDVILVLGRYATGQTSAPQEVAALRDTIPQRANWMLCAFGATEHACLLRAAQLGGDIRVGFENSLYAADGTLHPDNAASVATLIARLNTLTPMRSLAT